MHNFGLPAKQMLIQQVGFVNSGHFFQHRSHAKHWFKNLKILINYFFRFFLFHSISRSNLRFETSLSSCTKIMKMLFKIKNIKRKFPVTCFHWVEVLDLFEVLKAFHFIIKIKNYQSSEKHTFGNFNQRGHQTKCMVRIVATIA